WLVSFRFAASVMLLDLTDTFAVQAGGSMELVSGPRTYAQNWTQGFYYAHPNIDGVYFLSSLSNRPVMALFERALKNNPFPATRLFHRSLADPLMLIPIQEACKDIGYRFSPKSPF
ncbi:MAG: hypothetical protein ACR2RL_08135, partial [Gammaproteobacteria bacterium]